MPEKVLKAIEMKTILKTACRLPYGLLFLVLVVLLIAVLLMPDGDIVYHYADTYRVFTGRSMMWLLAKILLIWIGLYLLLKRFLWSEKLSWIHIVSTCIGVILVAGQLTYHQHFSQGFAGRPRRYYDDDNLLTIMIRDADTLLAFLTTGFILAGACLFLVNLLVGVFRTTRTR